MPIKVTCSNCGGVLHAPDDAGGKRGRCPTCGNVLPIPAEAPRVSASAAALHDAPKPAARSQSFGELAPAASVDAPPARVASDKRKASVPLPPPSLETPRNRVAFGSKIDQMEGGSKGWRRVGRGLWWTRVGVFFLLLPFVILNGINVYEILAKQPLPVKDPGYVGVAWLNSTQEIQLAAIGGSLALGLPTLLLGRLGVSGSPKRARTSGLASFAAFAALVALGGGIMFLLPAVAMVATTDAGKTPDLILKLQNQPPQWQMFGMNDTEGLLQRGGILLGFLGLALSELWFLASLGRIGTALDSPRLAGRTTRMTLLYGLFLVVAFGASVSAFRPVASQANSDFVNFTMETTKYLEGKWSENGQPQYDKLGEYKPVVRPAANTLLALFIGLGYFRMIGAGRRAVRNWLETHERP